MDESLKNDLGLTEKEIELLNNRSILYKRLALIQKKYSIPALSILQYYARALKIDANTNFTDILEEKLVKSCIQGNKLIIKNIKDICNACTLDEDEQEKFYRLILNEGYLCDYFLTHKPLDILKKISYYNCEGFDKMMTLLRDIDPNFDFNKYFDESNK